MTLILPPLRLKKNEDRRIRMGHAWVFSNEVNTDVTPLKKFSPGEEVLVEAHDKSLLGVAYINPHSLITARLFSTNIHARLNEDFFYRHFLQALTFRDSIFPKPYYRLIFGEADGLPGLIIDRFAHDFVIQINTFGMELKIDPIVSALQRLFPELRSILCKNDTPIRIQEGLTLYVKSYGECPDEITLEENHCLFRSPLSQGQKTGWFYDHRFNRLRLKDYVKQKSVLDVFSYLGGFGIQAAVFGASKVDCIEASSFASNYIKTNAELNSVAEKVNVLTEDAFTAMKQLLAQGKQYDVIIVDPPAFVKKLKDKKEGLIAYQRINEMALKLLTHNGILFSCSCSMHISMDDLIQIMQKITYKTKMQMQILERGHQGPDHPIHPTIPETDYLKLLVIRKMGC